METIRTIINPTPEQIDIFCNGLCQYNAQFVLRKFEPFSIALENEEGEIVGGIKGESFWGRLHIEMLWINQDYRKQGLGKKLIAMAEIVAKERKCKGIDLDTMTFQAPGFYEKMGFRQVGELPNYDNEFKRIYYAKDF
jgi:ribosomal protein S18 acetylase RimI-like enzyme